MRSVSLSTAATLAILLGVGCTTTIQGTGADAKPQVFDAGLQAPAIDGQALADAVPAILPDAEIQITPCVEGNAQSSDVDGTCYLLFNGALSWAAAQAQCVSLGGSLPIIESAAEQTLVGALAGNYGGQPDLWLGAKDDAVEGTFVWADGSALTYTHWRAGEPNNYNNEDCMIIEGDNPAREWDDRICGDAFPSICERAPGD